MISRWSLAVVLCALPVCLPAQEINFGDDASEWALDGECDDRRFRGSTMAPGLDRDDVGHDASDCKSGYVSGALSIWEFSEALPATDCSVIDFGDDTSEWANDGLCDDYRFDGPGGDFVLLREDTGKDATDCRQLCEQGEIALRDY
ncbi:hypothetical protein [Sulfitobacter sp. JB4-11]|uniref:hypothetical protein n=1 Tax=Sulfitobacter rhodophyticola TaxID=3238304 RepID=UPI003515DFD0